MKGELSHMKFQHQHPVETSVHLTGAQLFPEQEATGRHVSKEPSLLLLDLPAMLERSSAEVHSFTD